MVLLLMEEIMHQLRLVGFSIFYKVLTRWLFGISAINSSKMGFIPILPPSNHGESHGWVYHGLSNS